MGCTACTGSQCLYKGTLHLFIYHETITLYDIVDLCMFNWGVREKETKKQRTQKENRRSNYLFIEKGKQFTKVESHNP
jgi:hypothetical protein